MNRKEKNQGVQEYLDALGEQIENPHARAAIRREIGNHIEEQTEDLVPIIWKLYETGKMGLRAVGVFRSGRILSRNASRGDDPPDLPEPA